MGFHQELRSLGTRAASHRWQVTATSWRRLGTVLLVGLLSAGCDRPAPPPSAGKLDAGTEVSAPTVAPEQSDAAEVAPPVAERMTHSQQMLRRIEGDIVRWRKMGEARQGWFHYDELAAAHLARAQLTRNPDDYAAAGEAIEKAFTLAKPGTGPFLRRARYSVLTGEFGRVEPDVQAARKALEQRPEDLEAAESLRGDVAAARGDFEAARRHYQAAIAARRSFGSVGRIAELDLVTGRFDDARRGFDEVLGLSGDNRMQRAWALLQRGVAEYEAGSPSAALPWFEQAAERFTGWWESAERIGDVRFAAGDYDAAIAQYELAVGQAPHAALMAKVGDAFAAKGDIEQAAQWRAEARSRLAVELEKAEGVFTADAVRVLAGEDPQQAVARARKHAAQRPTPAARVLLAQAQLASGDTRGAQATLRRLLGEGAAGSELGATVALAFDEDDSSVTRPPVEKGAVELVRQRLRLDAAK